MALPFAAWLVLPVSLTHPSPADVHLDENLGFGGVQGNPAPFARRSDKENPARRGPDGVREGRKFIGGRDYP
ncbi:hypothetical protein SPYCW_3689 [Sphingopyxis sp. EG6]|nr:hypothetical protein SPYCW_3689 [Sphingopyxis sp. EG6]